MQTIVLAAGEGTRMRPLTADQPKPMLPVANSSIIQHTLDSAIDAGADEFIVVVGYEQQTIRETLGESHHGIPITYVEQESQEGTADAVKTAAPVLAEAPFAVLNGDALYDAESLKSVFDSGPAVGSYRVDNPSEYGVLQLDANDEFVEGVLEKPADPPSNLINTGAYVFPAEATGWLDVGESERGELELTDVLAKTCDEYSVTPVSFDQWLDIGRPWELLEANEWKLTEIEETKAGDIHPDAELLGPVAVEEGATIRSGVVIEGPALVKSGATVGPNAYVRGASLIGERVKIGHSVEIKNSVILPDASVGHLSYVGDSVLGNEVNFGAGTTVANLRHDDEPVEMDVKGEKTSTGRRKFGCVCGPRVKTGINTSLNAGVKLDAGATTMPGERIL